MLQALPSRATTPSYRVLGRLAERGLHDELKAPPMPSLMGAMAGRTIFNSRTLNSRAMPPLERSSRRVPMRMPRVGRGSRLRHMLERVHLVGLSLGGYAALQFELRYP
jgi:hypothetical protein